MKHYINILTISSVFQSHSVSLIPLVSLILLNISVSFYLFTNITSIGPLLLVRNLHSITSFTKLSSFSDVSILLTMTSTLSFSLQVTPIIAGFFSLDFCSSQMARFSKVDSFLYSSYASGTLTSSSLFLYLVFRCLKMHF